MVTTLELPTMEPPSDQLSLSLDIENSGIETFLKRSVAIELHR